MKSYGTQLVEQFVEGDLPLVALYNWADQWGRYDRDGFDPANGTDLYLSALLQGFKANNKPQHEVFSELAAAIDVGGGI